jgi:hypothetical protein
MKHHRKTRKGGGYGFGGSILADAGGSNAGNAQWNSDTSQDCGVDANRGGNGTFAGGKRRRTRKARRGGAVSNESLMARGGNNTTGGRRRKHKTRKGGSITAELGNRGGNGGGRRKRMTRKRGGAYVDLAVQAPRTGYSFNGQGVGGTADTIPY